MLPHNWGEEKLLKILTDPGYNFDYTHKSGKSLLLKKKDSNRSDILILYMRNCSIINLKSIYMFCSLPSIAEFSILRIPELLFCQWPIFIREESTV